MFRFRDREEAGQYLAERLLQYANAPDAVVLWLPLDIFLVRKLGVPGYEELTMGAIATGGVRVMNEDMRRQISVSDSALRPSH